MIDTRTEQAPAELKKKTRELAYLDKQNILNEEVQPQFGVPSNFTGGPNQRPDRGQTRQTAEQLKQKLKEIAVQRKLAQTQHLENLESLKVPTSLLMSGFLTNKSQLYESMRRHELDVKNYMRSKIISLKEDVI